MLPNKLWCFFTLTFISRLKHCYDRSLANSDISGVYGQLLLNGMHDHFSMYP